METIRVNHWGDISVCFSESCEPMQSAVRHWISNSLSWFKDFVCPWLREQQWTTIGLESSTTNSRHVYLHNCQWNKNSAIICLRFQFLWIFVSFITNKVRYKSNAGRNKQKTWMSQMFYGFPILCDDVCTPWIRLKSSRILVATLKNLTSIKSKVSASYRIDSLSLYPSGSPLYSAPIHLSGIELKIGRKSQSINKSSSYPQLISRCFSSNAIRFSMNACANKLHTTDHEISVNWELSCQNQSLCLCQWCGRGCNCAKCVSLPRIKQTKNRRFSHVFHLVFFLFFFRSPLVSK